MFYPLLLEVRCQAPAISTEGHITYSQTLDWECHQDGGSCQLTEKVKVFCSHDDTTPTHHFCQLLDNNTAEWFPSFSCGEIYFSRL